MPNHSVPEQYAHGIKRNTKFAEDMEVHCDPPLKAL